MPVLGQIAHQMKVLFSALFTLALAASASAQITIEEYDHKVRCAVVEEDKLVAPAAATGEDCGEITITFADMLASGGCSGTVVRTWTYTDECDNSRNLEQFIYRSDDTGPVFDNPPGDVRCFKSDLPAIPELTATDLNGLPVKITYTERSSGPILARMWTATDSCGNETKIMQKITLLDPQ